MRGRWFKAMRDFYRKLDRELAGRSCAACGRCCRFDEADHVLCASRLERRYLALTARVPDNPDAPPELLAAGRRCPFQTGGRCGAREGRVLGCRLYFCGPGGAADGEALAELWHGRLKRLHEEFGAEWEYGRLFPMREP